jgi:hypothetical protein
MKPVFLLDVIHTTVVPDLMQKNLLFFGFGMLGLTVEPSPDFRTSIVQTAEPDPQVFAALHMSSGFGSSQMYLLFAWARVPLNNRIVVAIATPQERDCLFMINPSKEI